MRGDGSVTPPGRFNPVEKPAVFI